MHDYYKDTEISDEDIRIYFAFSEKGIRSKNTRGFMALKNAKTWRDWHFKTWKEDLKKGIIFLKELKEDIPEYILEYL